MFKRIALIWVVLTVVFLILAFFYLPRMGETPLCPHLPMLVLAVATTAFLLILGRVIRSYADAVLLAYELGRMGILTRSPDECEKCKEIQEDVEKELKKLRKKIPWWKLIAIGATVLFLAALCASTAVVGPEGIVLCIAAILALIGELLELAAEGEDVVEEKKELEEKRKKLEEHQNKEHQK